MALDPSIAALFQPQGDQPDQSMMADALRQREQLGMLAQLSGNQTAQPFAQTVLKGVADERDAQTAAGQQAAQRQMSLAQLVAKQKEQATDNDRQERSLAEQVRFHKDLAANPAMAQVWGMGAAQPGETAPPAPSLFAMNPRSGVAKPVTDPNGNPILQAPKAGAEGGEAKLKDKLIGDLGKDLDPTTGRSNLATNQQKQLEAAERIETLLNAPGPFNTERLGEAVTMAATIANGGATPTESQRAMLLPHTARGNLAKYLEFVTNTPQDAAAQDFIAQLRQQSEREKTTAGAQMQRTMLGRLVKHQEAFSKYPEEAARIAEGAKLKGKYDAKTLLPLETIDPVAEAGGGDKKARLVSRIGVLKAQGLDAAAIKAKLKEEGF